jgi:hypothetical protein
VLLGAVTAAAWSQDAPGEAPARSGTRVDQALVSRTPLRVLRMAGLRMFSTPFNSLDGYGDGPLDPGDTRSPGGRPTLGGNGTFLRVNGLDAQTCLECHSIVSAAAIPAVLGIGGVGGSNSNAIIMTTTVDSGDTDLDGSAALDGRFANPPFVFGAGAVELLAKEMTLDLQALKQSALDTPDTVVSLTTKGVSFGALSANESGELDTSGVVCVDADLVVRPFGHLGMQPTEAVGTGDPDADGVSDEVLPGDLSVLSVFIATLERPFQQRLSKTAKAGLDTFEGIGCANCHIPSLETEQRRLPLTFPEVPDDPFANAYLEIDLTRKPMRFRRNGAGGVVVPLFADLKRHDMGPGLAETFSLATERQNREFTTARLWGVADTAPYLHDGRATTLSAAILAHGGEAEDARDAFAALADSEREQVLAFLRSLRTPRNPAAGLARRARRTQ